MNHPNAADILLHEDNYIENMHAQAEPLLTACREDLTLFREEGHPLHCVRYDPSRYPAASSASRRDSHSGSATPSASIGRDLPDNGAIAPGFPSASHDAPPALRGVVIMSHGFTETTEKYHELIYYFLRCGYVVSIQDHCGHGRSYRLTADASRVHIDRYERYRDDLLFTAHAAQDAYPELPLYLFGHSMGGGIAAAAAAAEPALFARVILSSPMIRPTSGGVPWFATRIICSLFCAIGRGEHYAPGQGPYQPGERFESSAASSEPRFRYYQEIRDADPSLQMGGATYGWMNAAARLSTFLLRDGWRTISCPLLLFQADRDAFVMNAQQDAFVTKLSACNPAVRLIHMDGTKHEVFNSCDDILTDCLDQILSFLD